MSVAIGDRFDSHDRRRHAAYSGRWKGIYGALLIDLCDDILTPLKS